MEGSRIVIRYLIDIEIGVDLADLTFRVLNDGQIPQSQKVHFQKTQLFNGGHGILGDDGIVIAGKGYIGADRLRGDHHTGCMGGGVSGHTLQAHGRVDQLANAFVCVVHLL